MSIWISSDNLPLNMRNRDTLDAFKRFKLFENGFFDNLIAGTFESLRSIHLNLFEDIYYFAGKMRDVNISKGNFRFAPVTYLEDAIKQIEKMPQSNFNEIIDMTLVNK